MRNENLHITDLILQRIYEEDNDIYIGHILQCISISPVSGDKLIAQLRKWPTHELKALTDMVTAGIIIVHNDKLRVRGFEV